MTINPQKRKTAICQHWETNGGVCPFGDKCSFAHGAHELQAAAFAAASYAQPVSEQSVNPYAAPFTPRPAVRRFTPRRPMQMTPAAPRYMIQQPMMQQPMQQTMQQRLPRRADLYKTTLCQHWETSGACPFGMECSFAHGTAELQPKPAGAAPVFRVGYPAPTYSNGGFVSQRGGYRGMTPQFQMPMKRPMTMQMTPPAKRFRPDLFKTTLCQYFQQGMQCKFAERCHYAHGEAELRQPGATPGTMAGELVDPAEELVTA
eukprot:NODE_4016_length_856_cov_40.545953_g3859_i0.p1 GENE.NODE_4016_length_856_cov_40.545953_g3859_i0~~NODE_4016_length_856_cov_40.545953_g3859_i0.p1  ORF type:complete len:260 (-),score=22.34 NODE_4016_length_856_cov_40.545953_g3859_i0:41-820(-)